MGNLTELSEWKDSEISLIRLSVTPISCTASESLCVTSFVVFIDIETSPLIAAGTALSSVSENESASVEELAATSEQLVESSNLASPIVRIALTDTFRSSVISCIHWNTFEKYSFCVPILEKFKQQNRKGNIISCF